MSLSPAQLDEIQDRRETVAALTRQGYTADQIANILRVSGRTVQRYRVITGTSQPAPRPFTDEELALARNLLEEGAGYGEVSRTIGHDRSAVRRRLPGYGLPVGGGRDIRYVNQMLRQL